MEEKEADGAQEGEAEEATQAAEQDFAPHPSLTNLDGMNEPKVSEDSVSGFEGSRIKGALFSLFEFGYLIFWFIVGCESWLMAARGSRDRLACIQRMNTLAGENVKLSIHEADARAFLYAQYIDSGTRMFCAGTTFCLSVGFLSIFALYRSARSQRIEVRATLHRLVRFYED